jgi:hypothetical protein
LCFSGTCDTPVQELKPIRCAVRNSPGFSRIYWRAGFCLNYWRWPARPPHISPRNPAGGRCLSPALSSTQPISGFIAERRGSARRCLSGHRSADWVTCAAPQPSLIGSGVAPDLNPSLARCPIRRWTGGPIHERSEQFVPLPSIPVPHRQHRESPLKRGGSVWCAQVLTRHFPEPPDSIDAARRYVDDLSRH